MRKSTIAVVGALTLAVVAVPTVASASNGHAWLLGRSNAESAVTTVTNSAGTPLSLKAKSGYAPFAVNSSKTVTNLSADKLDGLSSGSFLRSTGKAADADKLDGLSSGSFARATGITGTIVASGYNVAAHCPSGTIATGGGGISMGDYDPGLAYSGPDFADTDDLQFIKGSWLAIDPYYDTVSFVQCYSPSGKAIAGNLATSLATQAAAPRGVTTLTKGEAAYVGHLKDLKAGVGIQADADKR